MCCRMASLAPAAEASSCCALSYSSCPWPHLILERERKRGRERESRPTRMCVCARARERERARDDYHPVARLINPHVGGYWVADNRACVCVVCTGVWE